MPSSRTFRSILAAFVACALAVAADPAGAAAAGAPPVPGPVLRTFDPPPHPYGAGHRGVDLAASPGEQVRSVRRGRVAFAGEVAGADWITVDHGGGLTTTYGGVLPDVTLGEEVHAGQVLGRIAAGREWLDWGARWHRGSARSYFDPLLLLADLRARLVAPVREGIATTGPQAEARAPF